MSIDNRRAAVMMRALPEHQRSRMIADAGDKVIDLREQFAREQAKNGCFDMEPAP